MLTVVEVVLMVSCFILLLSTPKKKYSKIVDTNTNDSHYAIDEYGYIVKL
ncbi:hypothetical protein BDD43_3966 [Mucilaginibacter gracilis]|uniref:Uncharacterized protein n=1 Tax=Mucilaginibacter gracilis TaxID=423350 RepID=A0A495J559_9SPHI|nr:hypothetical protein BDD43_3966 [Mucilaginibacter gracilis]